MSVRDIAVYVFLAVTWGSSFLVLLHVIQGFGWGGAVTLRALIAGGTLLLFAWVKGQKIDIRKDGRALCVVGATAIAGLLVGMSYATPKIGTAMAAIFVATIPLFSVFIGRLWGLEKLTVSKMLGLLLGLLGIVLLVGFPEQDVSTDFLLGCSVSIAGAICSAFGGNYASLRLARTGALQVSCGSFLVGGVLTLPLLIWVPIPDVPQVMDYGYLLISACLMSAITYVLYFDLIKRIGATRTISVEFLVTLIAMLIGAVFLGEQLTAIQLVGAGVVMLGSVLVLGLLGGRRRSAFD